MVMTGDLFGAESRGTELPDVYMDSKEGIPSTGLQPSLFKPPHCSPPKLIPRRLRLLTTCSQGISPQSSGSWSLITSSWTPIRTTTPYGGPDISERSASVLWYARTGFIVANSISFDRFTVRTRPHQTHSKRRSVKIHPFDISFALPMLPLPISTTKIKCHNRMFNFTLPSYYLERCPRVLANSLYTSRSLSITSLVGACPCNIRTSYTFTSTASTRPSIAYIIS